MTKEKNTDVERIFPKGLVPKETVYIESQDKNIYREKNELVA